MSHLRCEDNRIDMNNPKIMLTLIALMIMVILCFRGNGKILKIVLETMNLWVERREVGNLNFKRRKF